MHTPPPPAASQSDVDELGSACVRYFDDADHATLLADGKVHRDWVDKPMPLLLHVRHSENVVAIVTEIAPYRKRGRP